MELPNAGMEWQYKYSQEQFEERKRFCGFAVAFLNFFLILYLSSQNEGITIVYSFC